MVDYKTRDSARMINNYLIKVINIIVTKNLFGSNIGVFRKNILKKNIVSVEENNITVHRDIL